MCRKTKLLIVYGIFLLLATVAVQAQEPGRMTIDLSLQQATVLQSLQTIENKSGIRFCFLEGALEKESKKITLDKKGITITEALKIILDETRLRYKETPNCIVIEEKPTAPAAQAQAPGKLKGRIVEFETSQPLPGASVHIRERNLGISANDGGYYQFDLPAGAYTLEVSFTGFAVVTQQVTITAGKDAVYDIKMQADNSLAAVVVKARRGFTKAPVNFTSEKQLISEIRVARAVVSGISNEQITKTADRNAAEAVRRIAGITVTDNRFIEVRGMNQRYNLTYLNNNIAPSTELYNRAFAYDLLPSSVIDRMLVYKSPTAELFGDYAGGAVKIFTKDAQPVRHLEVGVQTAWREGTTFKEMNSYKGGNLDWLGFDDGTRRLPTAYNKSLGKEASNLLTNSEAAAAFNSNLTLGTQRALPDLQLFANYFDSWKLAGGRLYNLSSITYVNENRRLIQHNQTGNTYKYLTDGDLDHGGNNRIGTANQGIQVAKISALQNFTYRLKKRTTIEFKNFFLNEGQLYAYDEISRLNTHPSYDSANGFQLDRVQTLGFQQRTVYSGNLGARHLLGGDSARHSTLQYNFGYTYTLQNIPDQRRINLIAPFSAQPGSTEPGRAEIPEYRWRAAGSNVGTEDALRNGMMNRMFQQNNEHLYNFSADYSFWLLPSLSLKAGTYHFFRDRAINRRFFKVNRAGLTGAEVNFIESPDPIRDKYGDNNRELLEFTLQDLDRVWSDRYFTDDNTGLKIYDATSPVDRYIASEQHNSGYVMADWQSHNKKLIVNAGLRVERNHIKLAGAIPVGSEATTGNYKAVKVDELKTVALPSINITYEPVSNWVLRAAYGRTVNRPEIREKAPFADFDYQNNELIRGNTELITATIDNADLRVEWYPKKGNQNEMISAGVFYKFLKDPIERVREQSSGFGGTTFPMVTFVNAKEATVYGLEFDLRKSLSFFPGGFFRNLSFIGNGSLIHSEAKLVTPDISISGGQSAFYIDPALLTFTRRLQGQASYVFNAGFYYENPGWGTKITAVYNVNGPRIYAASRINPALADNLRARRDTGDNFGGKWGVVNAYLATRSNIVELPLHLLNASFQQRLISSLQLRISVQNLLGQSNRLMEDNNSNNRYNKEVPVDNGAQGADRKVYYTGDNIFRSVNTGRYYNLSLTYSF